MTDVATRLLLVGGDLDPELEAAAAEEALDVVQREIGSWMGTAPSIAVVMARKDVAVAREALHEIQARWPGLPSLLLFDDASSSIRADPNVRMALRLPCHRK